MDKRTMDLVARLATVLRHVEWNGGDCAGNPVCPSCMADRFEGLDMDPGKHNSRCELAVALLAAEMCLASAKAHERYGEVFRKLADSDGRGT